MAAIAASLDHGLDVSTLQIDHNPFEPLEESLHVLLYKLKGTRKGYVLTVNFLYCIVFCGKFTVCLTAFSGKPTLSLSVNFESAELHFRTAYWNTLGTNCS